MEGARGERGRAGGLNGGPDRRRLWVQDGRASSTGPELAPLGAVLGWPTHSPRRGNSPPPAALILNPVPLPAPAPPAPGSARRLGLFGGSFDPIHKGHLAAARAAQEAFGLDRVVFVPAARPPHKPALELASEADRLEMVRLAIAPEPSWSVCDLEFARPGPSYTVDTVRQLRARVGEHEDASIWLLIGADNLPGLAGWDRVEELLEEVWPIVIQRAEEPEELPAELVQGLSPAALERLRAGVLNLPPMPGRSTDLRAALRAGEQAHEDLPEEVGAYIRRRGLYGEA